METTTDFSPSAASGGRRCRRWPDEVKARIVNESLRPGAAVKDVAARRGVRANVPSSWRTPARRGTPAADGAEAAFATPVAAPIAPTLAAGRASSGPEVVIGSATIRPEVGASAERIASVVRALEGRP